MKYIILSDINGNTDYLQGFNKSFEGKGTCITPYLYQSMALKQPLESQYEFFQRVSSIDGFLEIAHLKLKKTHGPVTVIGFSVGATVAWRLSEQNLPNVVHYCCIFGSRIRDYLDIAPTKKVTAWFSKDESYFYDQIKETKLIEKIFLDMNHDDIKSIDKNKAFLKQILTKVKN